jgi:hypothetical protein
VTIELLPRGKQTELVLVHELLPNEHSTAQHTIGWQNIVEKLGGFLGEI